MGGALECSSSQRARMCGSIWLYSKLNEWRSVTRGLIQVGLSWKGSTGHSRGPTSQHSEKNLRNDGEPDVDGYTETQKYRKILRKMQEATYWKPKEYYNENTGEFAYDNFGYNVSSSITTLFSGPLRWRYKAILLYKPSGGGRFALLTPVSYTTEYKSKTVRNVHLSKRSGIIPPIQKSPTSRLICLVSNLTKTRPAQPNRPVRPWPNLFSDSTIRFSFKKRAHTTDGRNWKTQNNCSLLYSTN